MLLSASLAIGTPASFGEEPGGAPDTGPISIGTVGEFSVLGATAITNTGLSTLTDGLGISPLTAVTGFPPGHVSGGTHIADLAAATAQVHAAAAYDEAVGRASAVQLVGDLAGRTLPPGVYRAGAALAVSTTLVLDGQGDPSSVFIFQVDAAMNVAAAGAVRAVNGTQPANIFWQVNGAVTLGASSAFTGTVVATGAVTVGAGATVAGRVVSLEGAVSLASSTLITTTPIALGAAASYSVLAGGAVTNTGPTILSGDLGVSPWFEIQGFPEGLVSGSIEQGTAAAGQAMAAARAASLDASERITTGLLPSELASLSLRSGVHHASGPVSLNGTVLLDAQNNPNAVFVLRVAGALTTGPASSIRLINGAQGSRVFWQVDGDTELGAASDFSGTLLGTGQVTVGVRTSLIGRILSLTGAVRLRGTTVADTVPVPLASATTYSVLASTAITNTGQTVLSGDLGVYPGTAVTGFPPGVVEGTLHIGDSGAALAQSDARLAFTDAQTRTATGSLVGDIAGATLRPGVYSAAAALTLSGNLKLDAENNPSAVFIFQIGAAFTTGATSTIELLNGAQSDRVFWQVLGATTLGAGSTFRGTVLGVGAITLGADAVLDGRALSLDGAVSTGANPVTNPEPFRGALTASSSDVALAAIVLDGTTAQPSATASEPWSITDARGSGEGWALTVSATAPTSAAGTVDAVPRQLPVDALTLSPGPVLAGSGADPADGIVSLTLLLSTRNQTLISTTGSHRGTYLISPTFTLRIPANAFRSNYARELYTSELTPYVATITITIG